VTREFFRYTYFTIWIRCFIPKETFKKMQHGKRVELPRMARLPSACEGKGAVNKDSVHLRRGNAALAIGIGVGVGLVGFCLGGTSKPMRSPFTWNALPIFTLGIIAQQLFAKYYKARTVGDEMLRNLISGFIVGAANAFIFWG
jgi:hypothetical protein